MMWKRRSEDGIQQLPEERKVLAERYTIDAEEAHRREQLPAAVAAREMKEQARRAAQAELDRRAAEVQARRAAEAGIDMLLEKPLEIPVLLETIRNLLAQPEQSRLGKVLRIWHTKDLSGHDE